MQNRGAVFRLIVSALFCVCVLCYNGYLGLSDTVRAADDWFPAAQSVADVTKAPEKKTESTKSESTPESSVPTNSTTVTVDPKIIETAAAGTVQGKVSEKFITPYTAPLSFDSVYLKNSTSKSIDIQSFLTENLPYTVQKDGTPQVLILHTHTTECFLPESRDYYTDKDVSRTRDERYNMVLLGNIVTKKIQDAGFGVVHDTTVHDYPEYNGSYDRAAETIRKQLKANPSIKIVIDMHRDAISSENDKTKLVTEIGGKKAAQIMLVMGCQDGSVTNFPHWQENLKLAVRLQQTVEKMYPTLARPLSLMPRKYNENLTTGSLLIETGTDANSIEEAAYSAELLGDALVQLLENIS